MKATVEPSTGKSKRLLPGWASVLVSSISLLLVIFLLADARSEIAAQLSRLNIGFLLLGLGLGMTATFVGFLSFAAILVPMLDAPMRLGRLGHLHFTAQLLKHLPGRVFGIAYQIGAGREGSSAAWIAANGLHILLTLYTACVVSACVLLWPSHPAGAAIVLAAGSAAWLLAWRSPLPQRLLRWSEGKHGRVHRLVRSLTTPMSRLGNGDHLRILGWMMISWIAYFLAWAAYGLAATDLGALEGVLMSARYNLAWLVGYVTLVTPSGIGIREAAFLAMGDGFSASQLAYGVLIGRLSLLLIDFMLGLIFLPFHVAPNDDTE